MKAELGAHSSLPFPERYGVTRWAALARSLLASVAAVTLSTVFAISWSLELRAADDEERPRRLTDSLGGQAEWDIALPDSEPQRDFRASVLSGTALESTVYQEILDELRLLTEDLGRAPTGVDAGARLSTLRQRLRQRVRLNMDAGYFFAAGVYIELLDFSGASDDEIQLLTESLQARREQGSPG